jgi:hypothetical protein
VSGDEPVIWIRIEADAEDDGRLAWTWAVVTEKGRISYSGASYSLSECLDTIHEYVDAWMRKANATPDA